MSSTFRGRIAGTRRGIAADIEQHAALTWNPAGHGFAFFERDTPGRVAQDGAAASVVCNTATAVAAEASNAQQVEAT